ncbi:transglutaminase-like domain-containing protein [Marinoscillum furvescens]|uniref:Transglutaminase superfamily protein n=1 Tax=Marinoscillum furvescens DSM 4134 TaxID=1122208 RepID=A0A3D9KZQ8_MARFU|nr:transglutaminase-like domain-containing protein [Marinoscillum furvescens]RED92645.1 transglutaminase superfamily protein [Marinoscillum furvescens DSM 4134]
MKDTELKALVTLLEDEDEEIVTHVEQKLMELGTGVIPLLEEEWESAFNPLKQRRIEDLIHMLQFELFQERLEDWKTNRSEDLLEGMWLIATYQYPDLDLDDLRQQIHQLYVEVWRELREDLLPYDQVRIINSVLFNGLKFRANTKNFHSPANSMINAVLESKKGNPISLCAVYMLIAQKLELPIYGVNLPNLFILMYEGTESTFYINAFNKGLIFTKQDIDNYLEHLNIPPQDYFYEPCSNEDIILRCLRNLVVSFEKLGDYHKSDELKTVLSKMDDQFSGLA